MAEPFYLYTRRHSGNYYVQFRLEDGSLSKHKSTGTPNYNEARKLAMQWYSSGQVPERINSKSEKHKMSELEKVQLIKQLKIYDFEYEDIQTIVDILRADYVSKVFGVAWGNEMSRLANLLAMNTGMRADEVQALYVIFTIIIFGYLTAGMIT